jgi:penicillin-binding protein 1A
MSMLEQELEKAEKNFLFRKIIIGLIILSAFIGILGGFVYWTISDLPKIKSLEEYTPIESSRVYSSDGKIIAELYIERRTFIPHYQIPDCVKRLLSLLKI